MPAAADKPAHRANPICLMSQGPSQKKVATSATTDSYQLTALNNPADQPRRRNVATAN
jgi:hypothetical protein